MKSEIGSAHFENPRFQEAYGFGMDLWGDVLDTLEPGEVNTGILTVMAQSIQADIQEVGGFTEGDSQIVMQQTFRDIAESRGLIGQITELINKEE